MDPLLQTLSTLLLVLLPALILIYFCQSKRPITYHQISCTAHQAAGAWPIMGHLHLFGSRQLTHKTLGAMADKHGPVFTIRLGLKRILVLSSWEMARECFTAHDRVFSTRGSTLASRLQGYGLAMFGFAPYGEYWREMRKIVTIELLSNHRLDLQKHLRASEVKIWITELHDMWVSKQRLDGRALVDMKQWFGDFTHNLTWKMVGGKGCFRASGDCACEEGEARIYQKVMREFTYLFGVFFWSEAFPFLGWLDLKGYKKDMKRTAQKLENLFGRWLEEHKQKKLLGEGKGDEDFMDVMLQILNETKISDFDADTVNKATCLNLVTAGSDALLVTLTWVLSLLLNNPRVLKEVQDELNAHVGKDRHVDESDIKNLVYLQAVVKETMRLYPPSPIINLRAAMEDCTFAGYNIPAGTLLMVNAWKIHRDERVWPEPEEFRPERFLTSHKDINVRGKNFELIPFGSGRRSCPGISLALKVVHFSLASFLHSYEVAKPSDEEVDMSESLGLTNLKVTPLELLLSPRLRSNLYGQ